MHRRTRSRELALQCLYARDLRGADPEGGTEALLAWLALPEDGAGGVLDYARALVRGVIAELAAIDAALREAAENWSLERMAVVDRNVLRLGAWEILSNPEVPPKVAMDEAVELAKRFGAADSGAFVNGVLDRVRARAGGGPAEACRTAEAPPGGPEGRPEP